jgi:hypothetical protein
MSSTKITSFDLDESCKLKQIVVTLSHAGWSGSTAPYTQTIDVDIVTENNLIICSPIPALENFNVVGECKVLATEQSFGKLTFTAYEDKPSVDLEFQLIIGGDM